VQSNKSELRKKPKRKTKKKAKELTMRVVSKRSSPESSSHKGRLETRNPILEKEEEVKKRNERR